MPTETQDTWPTVAPESDSSERHGLRGLYKDAVAGLTVAIVALPVSIAFAIASGVPAERGLYACIVGGSLTSLLGSNRVLIAGPAGVFIALSLETTARFGVEGLLATILLSGCLLALFGAVRLGSLVHRIPPATVVGFIAAVAFTTLVAQFKELGGLIFHGTQPIAPIPKLLFLWKTRPPLNPAACLIGFGSALLIVVLRWLRPTWPGMLLAVLASSVATAVWQLPLETVGSHYSQWTSSFPTPRLPQIQLTTWLAVLPSAVSFALLSCLESLLAARVAAGLTGQKQRPNRDLAALGVANVASASFGGLPVIGVIARTVINSRAGARSRLAGVLQAAFVLLFLLVGAPLIRFIPLAALAGLVSVICVGMVDRHQVARYLRGWRDGSLLVATVILTLTFGSTVAIVAAFVAGLVFTPGTDVTAPVIMERKPTLKERTKRQGAIQ